MIHQDEIFAAAAALPASERPAYLDAVCHGQPEIRFLVEELLESHDATGFMDDETHLSPGSPDHRVRGRLKSEVAGDFIDRYKLMQEIGEGGFGTVWMAEQSEPIKRRVALKIIKLGMDTREVITRFEAERQALAMMDHPNIAKVLDAGATATGRPYFVMELVKGMPVTAFCNVQRLGTRERLELFADICSAISHAHQKGIIHRDIKPSNVLVTLHAGKPVIRVIDFGIAKATQQALTDKTLFTRHGDFMGTPAYMSPEQAAHSSIDIDTRSDIYSLGVLLYELLTGKPPFDAKTLVSAGQDEMRRIIREDEPPTPSTRLASATQAERINLAASHQTDPAKLSRMVCGELDWIVMKAIEKNRTRRYETANAFAEDIQRFLHDEPVVAAQPSKAYRFRKFARRNKLALSVAAIITTVLIAATGVSLWQAKLATLAARKAYEAGEDANAKAAAERTAREESDAIAKFLAGVFQSADPSRDGRAITVAEVLHTAAKKLETELSDQPARKAPLQSTLGITYFALGMAPEAAAIQEKVRDYCLSTFGPNHADTLRAENNLANSYAGSNRQEKALKLREEVLAIRRKLSSPDDPLILLSMHNLALSYADTGRRREALDMQEEALSFSRRINGSRHPDTLIAMSNLALSCSDAGRWEEGRKLSEEALGLSREILGPEHPDTLFAMNSLAISYADLGRKDEAVKLLEELLPLSRKVIGPKHQQTLSVMNNLGVYYLQTEQMPAALKVCEETLALRREVLGPENSDTLATINNVAICYANSGRGDEALKMRDEALKLSRKVNGAEHPNTLGAAASLAHSYADAGKRDEELSLLEEVLPLMKKVDGPENPDTLMAMSNLAACYFAMGRLAAAVKLQEETLAIRRRVLAPNDPNITVSMTNLASYYEKENRTAEAAPLRKELQDMNAALKNKEAAKRAPK